MACLTVKPLQTVRGGVEGLRAAGVFNLYRYRAHKNRLSYQYPLTPNYYHMRGKFTLRESSRSDQMGAHGDILCTDRATRKSVIFSQHRGHVLVAENLTVSAHLVDS